MKTYLVILGLVAVFGISAGSNPGAVTGDPASRTSVLSDHDLDVVVSYIVQALLKDPSAIAYTGETIEKETGIVIPEEDDGQIQAAVIARLRTTEAGRKVLAQLTSGVACAPGEKTGASCAAGEAAGRCSAYQACSLYGDLAGADETVLAMYSREKAEDGTSPDEALPAFDGVDLDGNPVSSADLVGTPTVLVFLAGHCGHSIASLGILQEVAGAFADRGVRVVGVFVNSGSGERVKSLVDAYDVTFPVWLHPDAAIGDVIHSHLVPTYFFVDAKGSMEEKLVGMKTKDQITDFVAAHLAEDKGD